MLFKEVSDFKIIEIRYDEIVHYWHHIRGHFKRQEQRKINLFFLHKNKLISKNGHVYKLHTYKTNWQIAETPSFQYT